MNLLFVLGSVYPRDDANSNIINRIAANLISRNEGVRIFELGMNDQLMSISVSIKNGVTIYGMGDFFKTKLSHRLRSYLEGSYGRSKWERIVLLAKQPNLVIEYVVKKILYGDIKRGYQSHLKKICAKERIDVIICVSYPILTAMAVAKSRTKLPFIYYQLDPYFSHYLQLNKRKALNQEKYICKRSNVILMTDLIYSEYTQSPLKEYLSKAIVLGYPAIEVSELTNAKPETKDEDFIRLAYIGTLYDDIRSPSFLFRLLKELVDRGNRLRLDVVGPLVGNVEIPKQLKWLTYHGRLSTSESRVFAEQADILVNIGNTIYNQMPSKIFEYFSTGKPIINLYKINDCPTLPYANKYPNCISIFESMDVSTKTCERVEAFIREYKGKLMSYDKVIEMFPEFTTSQVAHKFMQVIQNAITSQ